MEVRGQDKVIGMPTTLDYNPANRDSSSKLSSPALPSSEIRGIDQTGLGTLAHGNNTIFIQSQTLDPHHHPLHLSSKDNHHHQYHHQPQQLNPQPPPQKPRRDHPDPNPDPIPSPIVVCTPRATPTTTPIAGGSNSFKAPPAPPARASKSVRYRECLRNHAASSGGHVLDGCGEFMPSSSAEEEVDTPEALKCAACECHRNFHRKEVEGSGGDHDHDHQSNYYIYNHNKNNMITGRRDHYSEPAVAPPPQHPIRHHHQQYHRHQQIPPMMMAFGGGGGGGGAAAESSSEDLNINVYQSNYAAAVGQLQARKKRFRTKFSQEQKEKMMGLAQKLGWRIQKHDEEEVQQLCAQVGIKRQVFKVWMHNNKQAMKKKEAN